MRRNSDRPACVATRERPKPQRSCLSCSAKPCQNPHSHSGQYLTDQSTLARFESVGAPGRIPRLLRLKRPSSFEHLTRVIEQPDMCQDCAKAIVSGLNPSNETLAMGTLCRERKLRVAKKRVIGRYPKA